MEEHQRGHRWLDAILTVEFLNQIHTTRGLDLLKGMEIKTYQLLGWDMHKRLLNRTFFQSELLIKEAIKKECKDYERKD